MDTKPYMLLDYYLRCNNISVISQHLNSDEVGVGIPGKKPLTKLYRVCPPNGRNPTHNF